MGLNLLRKNDELFMNIMSQTENRAELENILAMARNKKEWKNAERQILREFRAKLGAPAEIAKRLDVSVATIYAWEKQTDTDHALPPPPERKLAKFLQLLESKGTKTEGEDAEILGKIRSVSYLFDCASVCDTFWTLRAGKPFVALNDDRMLDSIVDFLRLPQSPQSYLVFPTHQSKAESSKAKPKFTDAKVSCDGLMVKLQDKLETLGQGKLIARMKSVELPDRQAALDLGLADRWTAYAMAEYGPIGYARYGKSVDVWLEFVFDVSKDPQSERKEYTRWLELPREQAENWRDLRQEFWDKTRNRFGTRR
jgi:hypothetical protein